MTPRKLSTILIITVVATFISSIVLYDKNIDAIGKLLDVQLALSLLTYTYSYLPLEKNRKPYIIASLVVSVLAIIINFMIMGGYDFHFGKSI